MRESLMRYNDVSLRHCLVILVVAVIMQGKLVCADYGRPSDYELLSRHNVSLNGTVVIIRHNAVDISPLVYSAVKALNMYLLWHFC